MLSKKHGAAGRHDGLPFGGQLGQHFAFGLPESGFACFCEDFGNAFAAALFEQRIHIQKPDAELFCQCPADRAFAAAHVSH